jgi:hypothetical protein
VVDCWVIHHPLLEFHGAGGRGRRPWLCEHAPSSRTGADGSQAEERAIAADAHRIARVPCDEFLFFVFLVKALKKNTVCPVEKKGPAKSRSVRFYSISLIYSMLSMRGLVRLQGQRQRRLSYWRYSTRNGWEEPIIRLIHALVDNDEIKHAYLERFDVVIENKHLRQGRSAAGQ